MAKQNIKISKEDQDSNKIEYLKRQVDNASIRLSMAQAKYNSLVEKASMFIALNQQAELDEQAAENNWQLFLEIKSKLHSLETTTNESNLVSTDTLHHVKHLIELWEKVTRDTITAAKAIEIAAEYIQNRKVDNTLMSKDFVNDAIDAAKKAKKTVTTVIKGFKDAMAALGNAAKASNSTELTAVFVDELAAQCFINEKTLPTLDLSVEDKENLKQYEADHKPLEALLSQSLKEAKQSAFNAQKASENANKEMNKAKGELSTAEANLSSWEDALAKAEAAIQG